MERRPLRPDGGHFEPDSAGTAQAGSPELALVLDDRNWIDRMRSGNTQAYETLFRTHVRPLTAFAYRYVQSYDAALRVVQEVFARLWLGRHSWAFHGSVRGTLFASAHRSALEELRRTRSEARWHAGLPMMSEAAAKSHDAARGSAGQEDLYVAAQVAIARLPARARTIGFMRWSDRLSRAEIATVLGSNVRTIHTQITPASRAMRKRLAPLIETSGPSSGLSTLREAGDLSDRFTMIDPDRIESFLAGESIPTECEELRREIATAGGDPNALDAIESAWWGPGKIMEDLVDEDAAWHTLARRMSMPHDQTVRKETRQRSHLPLKSLLPSLPPLSEIGTAAAAGARRNSQATRAAAHHLVQRATDASIASSRSAMAAGRRAMAFSVVVSRAVIAAARNATAFMYAVGSRSGARAARYTRESAVPTVRLVLSRVWHVTQIVLDRGWYATRVGLQRGWSLTRVALRRASYATAPVLRAGWEMLSAHAGRVRLVLLAAVAVSATVWAISSWRGKSHPAVDARQGAAAHVPGAKTGPGRPRATVPPGRPRSKRRRHRATPSPTAPASPAALRRFP